MNKLSWNDIYSMDLDELILNEEDLPDELDIKSLDETNFEDFKNYIEAFAAEEEQKEEYVENEIDILEEQFNKSLFFGYASIPGIFLTHELFHILGAKSTGGTVHALNFGMDSSGFYSHVYASTPNTTSYIITGALPTLAIVPTSAYLIKKGIEEKDLKYSGIGWAGLFLHMDSFLSPGGDFYEIAATVSENTRFPCSDIGNVLLGGLLLSSVYATSYGAVGKWDIVKSAVNKLYKKIKR